MPYDDNIPKTNVILYEFYLMKHKEHKWKKLRKDICGRFRVIFISRKIDSFFICREKKELELTQVRQNIEDSKRLGSEKNIRNKSDLDRRIRELKSNNTKKFVEERKRQIMRHEREKENLVKSHEQQKSTLLAEIDKVGSTFFYVS